MFGYNFTTLIIILVIALLLFGPRRLPELGDAVGKAIRSFKKAHDDPSVLQQEEAGASTTAAPQAKACPKCNKEATGDFAFCPHCGANLKA